MALGKKLLRLEQDVVLLAARVALGVVLIAHGWQKLDEWGVSGTRSGFAQMGIPNADAAAVFAIVAELGGGVLLVAGLLTPLAALLVVANMAGAFWFVHRDGGVFVGEGGWELVVVIGAAALALFAAGAGRISLDGLLLALGRSRRARKQARKAAHRADTPATTEATPGDVVRTDDEAPATV